jgi:[glutamine synthetase] adenylyltransferase / [glutamine synthetase]-adenylyl-L-tyrosine phosphorylase
VATLDEAIERSAAPADSRRVIERLVDARPDVAKLFADDPDLVAATVAVTGLSRSLSRVVETDPDALSVLAALDHRIPIDAEHVDELVLAQRREELRIAARDLLALDPLEETVAAISALAADVVRAAHRLVAADGPALAVVGMGKLGGDELNYASDIDLMFWRGQPAGSSKPSVGATG